MEGERIPIIQVKNLYKIYRVGETRVHALDGVDFTVYKGEFCAIVGPSGSGKSTLLNMLAGLEKPTKGQIIIDGIHIETMTENQLVEFRRKRVGFIFQSYNLLQTLNAVENVALPLSFRGVPKKKRNAIAKKYLKLVGLQKQMKHMANAMSGGQQQRVGIARALAVNPKIIFADEPTGNLDSRTTMEILQLMRRIVREQNQTLIMVTHDNHLASFADRQFHIVDGKIVKIDDLRHDGEEPENGGPARGTGSAAQTDTAAGPRPKEGASAETEKAPPGSAAGAEENVSQPGERPAEQKAAPQPGESAPQSGGTTAEQKAAPRPGDASAEKSGSRKTHRLPWQRKDRKISRGPEQAAGTVQNNGSEEGKR